MSELTAGRLRELFDYSPDTGIFTRRTTVGNSPSQKTGYVAGSTNAAGYVIIFIDGRGYKAHRLAWLYIEGTWPKNHIDHLNSVKNDNRIDNLRDATRSENLQNQRFAHANNCSGFIGVHWHQASWSWQAQIRANGRRHHLGVFLTPELASEAYLKAKRELHEGYTI